jgi:hypothetical protein
MYTIDTDHGCGVIQKGSQEKLVIDGELTFENLERNRKEWLNIISVEKFLSKFDGCDLKSLIKTYITNPNNFENNWNLAIYYDEIGQTAPAVSYYIRTAERTNDDLLKYECLIRAAMCFEKQGTRRFTVKGMMQHAIATQPHRPEGYYLLSRYYEHDSGDGKWFDAYTTASIGHALTDFENLKPLRTKVDFPGRYALLFQKAHTAWWCGLCDDSREMFMDLYQNHEMDENHRKVVYDNLVRLNAFSSKSLNLYNQNKYKDLAFKFNNAERISQNYSEAYQDMFVLTLLNGKRNGTYLEIGSGHPTYGNNTYLLENEFDWKGISLDISEEFVKAHNDQRKHVCLAKDATVVNYDRLLTALDFPLSIDYLQIDCDPPEISYKVLLSMPFDTRKFSVITFEHDHYADPKGNYREKARKYLSTYGYKLFVSNVSPDKNRPYEDWFVHPDLINISAVESLMNISDLTKMAEDYMMGRLDDKKV